jgi:hypothetical protein
MEDLYDPPPLPPNPTGRQIRTALHDKAIANLCKPSDWMLLDEKPDNGNTYDPTNFPEALNQPEPMDIVPAATSPLEYSPSCQQGNTANKTLA